MRVPHVLIRKSVFLSSCTPIRDWARMDLFYSWRGNHNDPSPNWNGAPSCVLSFPPAHPLQNLQRGAAPTILSKRLRPKMGVVLCARGMLWIRTYYDGNTDPPACHRWLLILIRAYAALFLALLIATLSSISPGHSTSFITVRVLNAKNGRPLKGAMIGLVDPKREKPNQNPIITSAKTDADGVVNFRIPEGVTDIVIFYGDDLVDRCTPPSPFSVDEIVRSGVIGANNCPHGKFQYQGMRKPGELIIFGRPLSWWETMKRSE